MSERLDEKIAELRIEDAAFNAADLNDLRERLSCIVGAEDTSILRGLRCVFIHELKAVISGCMKSPYMNTLVDKAINAGFISYNDQGELRSTLISKNQDEVESLIRSIETQRKLIEHRELQIKRYNFSWYPRVGGEEENGHYGLFELGDEDDPSTYKIHFKWQGRDYFEVASVTHEEGPVIADLNVSPGQLIRELWLNPHFSRYQKTRKYKRKRFPDEQIAQPRVMRHMAISNCDEDGLYGLFTLGGKSNPSTYKIHFKWPDNYELVVASVTHEEGPVISDLNVSHGQRISELRTNPHFDGDLQMKGSNNDLWNHISGSNYSEDGFHNYFQLGDTDSPSIYKIYFNLSDNEDHEVIHVTHKDGPVIADLNVSHGQCISDLKTNPYFDVDILQLLAEGKFFVTAAEVLGLPTR